MSPIALFFLTATFLLVVAAIVGPRIEARFGGASSSSSSDDDE